jgi:hypothetical protein
MAMLAAFLAVAPTSTTPTRHVALSDRAMVRQYAVTRMLDPTHSIDERATARTFARIALLGRRPQLRACANLAFTRHHVEVLRTPIDLVLTPYGIVASARVVGAPFVDDKGTRCVEAVLTGTQVLDTHLDRNLRVRMRVVFFWQGSKQMNERTGEIERPWKDTSHSLPYHPPGIDRNGYPARGGVW